MLGILEKLMQVLTIAYGPDNVKHVVILQRRPSGFMATVETFDRTIPHEDNPDNVPARVEFGPIHKVAPALRRILPATALQVLAQALHDTGVRLADLPGLFDEETVAAFDGPSTWPEIDRLLETLAALDNPGARAPGVAAPARAPAHRPDAVQVLDILDLLGVL